MSEPLDVFISYRRRCAEPVQRLAQALDAAGVRYFLDTRDIGDWADVTADILARLADAKALLVWCSEDYLRSRPCQKELATVFIAQQQEPSATRKRILLVNAHAGVGHIYPAHLRNLQFALAPDLPGGGDFAALAARIGAHCAALNGRLGELGGAEGFAPPRWREASGANREPTHRFEGRDRELWDLHDGLHGAETAIISQRHGRAAVVSGIGGQGKSLLAQEYAFRFGPAFAGGVYWLSATEATPAADAQGLAENPVLRLQLLALLRQHGATVADTDPATVLLARLGDALEARRRPFLWIVDDLPDGLAPADFGQWLAPSTAGQWGKTLFTTRLRRYDSEAVPVPLPPLDPASALRLLCRAVAPADAAEEIEAARLADDLGRHALALWVASAGVEAEAGYAAAPYAAFRRRLARPGADALQAAEDLADELPTGHAKSIAATLLHSIRLLGEDGRDLLRLAAELADAVLPRPFLRDCLAAADGAEPEAARARVDRGAKEVERHSLGECPRAGLHVHALVARTLRYAEPDDARRAALGRTALAELFRVAQGGERTGDWRPLAALATHARALAAADGGADGSDDQIRRGWLGYLLGDMDAAYGALGAALALYRRAGERFARGAADEPDHLDWQRHFSVSHERIGDVQSAQGDGAGALASYRSGLAIAEKLAAQDPANAGWQRDLSVSHTKIGNVLRDQGDGAGALASYRAGLAIAEKLAAQDPANAGWQRDLSVSHNKIGDVLSDQGDLAGALASYRAGLAIAEKLAAQDPAHAGWQRDLAVSHDKIGDVLSAQGDLAGALASYRASLTIREKLAAQDPANAGWQSDLAFSHGKLGRLLRQMQKPTEALAEFRAALALLEPLVAKAPDQAQWRRALVNVKQQIAELETPGGKRGKP